MHFCQDELFAIMQLIPFLGAIWYGLRTWFRRVQGLPPITNPHARTEPHRHTEKCVGHGPYRTGAVTIPPKSLRERIRELFASLRAKLVRKIDAIRAPACATKGCEFKKGAFFPHSERTDHSVLWTDHEYLIGSERTAFSFGRSLPYKFNCCYCKRPFRIGDPIPKGAKIDYWTWMKEHRRRPAYLSETEWTALEASGYFDSVG